MKTLVVTTQYKKDIKLAKKQGKDLDKLFNIIEWLQQGIKLDSKYKDHKLLGGYGGYSFAKDCHIEYDWLLIYSTTSTLLTLIRLGTHSELFKKK